MHFKEAKGILSPSNGMNPYRGCTHGCIYCDSRSRCYGMDHDFEDVEVKSNAPELLEAALKSKRRPCMIGTGSMCDPYIPLERELCITRRCLELIDHYGFGFSVITKSDLILRDIDLLKSINQRSKAVAQITLTTLDEKLCRVLEPNVCSTARRFEVLCRLRDEGIPTVVWLCPVLPFINDTEENLLGLLDMCLLAGVKGIVNFGMGVTLREGDREYFYSQLDKSFPGIKGKYIRRFGSSYNCPSPKEKELAKVFSSFCKEHGIMSHPDRIFSYLNKYEDKQAQNQLSLF